MAYTTVVTHATGDVLPASDWNTYIRDNLAYLHGDGGATIDLSGGGQALKAASHTVGAGGNSFGGALGSNINNGYAVFSSGGSASQFLYATVQSDTAYRFTIDTNGAMLWGPGNAVADVNLYRSAAGGNLRTDFSFWAGNSIIADATSTGANRIYVGGALDTYVYRQAASILALNAKITEGAAQANVTVPTTWNVNLTSGLFQKLSVTAGGVNTLTIAAPTNNPAGSTTAFLVLRIANSGGGGVTLSWNAAFTALGVTALPASVANGSTSTSLFVFDPNAGKWCLLAVN